MELCGDCVGDGETCVGYSERMVGGGAEGMYSIQDIEFEVGFQSFLLLVFIPGFWD